MGLYLKLIRTHHAASQPRSRQDRRRVGGGLGRWQAMRLESIQYVKVARLLTLESILHVVNPTKHSQIANALPLPRHNVRAPARPRARAHTHACAHTRIRPRARPRPRIREHPPGPPADFLFACRNPSIILAWCCGFPKTNLCFSPIQSTFSLTRGPNTWYNVVAGFVSRWN